MEIYTIGHSNYSFDKFIEILKKYNIDCVVDIRAIPYSKYNTQYNKEFFQTNLKRLGYTYIYMADEFGAKRKTRTSYNNEGYADFAKVILEDDFKKGIERLKIGCIKGYRIVLLGAMQEPIRCPRAILVGKELIKEEFEVKHIMHEGNLKTQKYLEELLLEKYFHQRNQLTIDGLLGNDMNTKNMIEESYKLANKEIGYRIEKLNNK
ncbi:DUF488 domain-containing protein [Terrisporobacter petrolearius]|uniref:DUF488 domain-containing protein n=1 Tax=Terrisporobacter petrolearius TaxID=1460447 RepID=UPI001D15F5ED|nr:DUF488 domain-containing protein [Terrisporobacter petrolearius]MCC3864952.1 DUF488 domain-containing protein [Terrisporobacter petrolearius]